jgi:hypothetical protein
MNDPDMYTPCDNKQCEYWVKETLNNCAKYQYTISCEIINPKEREMKCEYKECVAWHGLSANGCNELGTIRDCGIRTYFQAKDKEIERQRAVISQYVDKIDTPKEYDMKENVCYNKECEHYDDECVHNCDLFSLAETAKKICKLYKGKGGIEGEDMSLNYVNRGNDEEIIDIVRSVLNNGTGRAETFNECVLIKLMQIRNTPIKNMSFDQNLVDSKYDEWTGIDKCKK